MFEIEDWNRPKLHTINVSPRPPEAFSVTPPPQPGELLQPPLWIFYIKRSVPLCLLPVYSYGSPLSIDTKTPSSLDQTVVASNPRRTYSPGNITKWTLF